MTVSYSVIDGGKPESPTFSFTSLANSAMSFQMATYPTTIWVDDSSPWTISPNPIYGSEPTERWITNSSATGISSPGMIIDPVFYHQFEFNASYQISGEGSTTPPELSSRQFGEPFLAGLSKNSGVYWLDGSAAWSLTNPIFATNNERLYTPSLSAGTVNSALTLSPIYYYQYLINFVSNPAGGGSIEFNGLVEPAGNFWENATSSLVALAIPFPGYNFSTWSSNTASITFSSLHNLTTSATILGSGTISAAFVSTLSNNPTGGQQTSLTSNGTSAFPLITSNPIDVLQGGSVIINLTINNEVSTYPLTITQIVFNNVLGINISAMSAFPVIVNAGGIAQVFANLTTLKTLNAGQVIVNGTAIVSQGQIDSALPFQVTLSIQARMAAPSILPELIVIALVILSFGMVGLIGYWSYHSMLKRRASSALLGILDRIEELASCLKLINPGCL